MRSIGREGGVCFLCARFLCTSKERWLAPSRRESSCQTHCHSKRNSPFTPIFGIMPCIASTGKKRDHHAIRTEELRHMPQAVQVARPLRRGPLIHQRPSDKTHHQNPVGLGTDGRAHEAT